MPINTVLAFFPIPNNQVSFSYFDAQLLSVDLVQQPLANTRHTAFISLVLCSRDARRWHNNGQLLSRILPSLSMQAMISGMGETSLS
jgi:hypothetical protein